MKKLVLALLVGMLAFVGCQKKEQMPAPEEGIAPATESAPATTETPATPQVPDNQPATGGK